MNYIPAPPDVHVTRPKKNSTLDHVWFYDGDINYMHGEHAALFVVAMGICILFLLPCTLALIFIPVFEHYSEHNKLFNYLHAQVGQPF